MFSPCKFSVCPYHHFLQHAQMLIFLFDSCFRLIAMIIFEGLAFTYTIFSKILIHFNLKICIFLSIRSHSKFSANNGWILNFLFATRYWHNLSCFLWFRFCNLDSLVYIIDLTWNEHSFSTEKLILRHNAAISFNNVEKFKICFIQNMPNCCKIATQKSKHHHSHYSVRKPMQNGLIKR